MYGIGYISRNLKDVLGIGDTSLLGLGVASATGLSDYVKADLTAHAEPFVAKTLNNTNIKSDFGEGRPFQIVEDVIAYDVETPVGPVMLTTHTWNKLATKGRVSDFGLIKPTLTRPLYVLQDTIKDRLIFVKTFKQGNKVILFYSVVGDFGNVKNGSITNFNKESYQDIIEKIESGNVRYIAPELRHDSSSTAPAKNIPLVAVGSLLHGYTDIDKKSFSFDEKKAELGKPTIKFEFEDNQALADFLTKTKGNVDYAETVDADTFSNPMTVNNRRQSRKAAQQKALTDTPSNYLPPSDGTPSLPPSPTSPKSLPPYVEPQPESTEPEVTAESVTDEEIETSNVTPVEIDWKAFEDAFAKASNWSSFDPERSARSYVGGYKEYYDQYVKQVPPQYLNAFNWFVKRYVSDLISKRSRTASAAVTGPGGITAQKAASLNRANDRFMSASVEFPHALLKYINKIRLREKRNAFVNSSIDDRYAQRISELKKEINGLMYLKDTYEHIAKGGEIPEEVLRRYAWMSRAYGTSNLREHILKSLNYNLNLQKATFKDKLTREVSKGNVEVIDAIIDYLKPKGLFTNRAEIWQFPTFVRTRRESVERETQRVADAAADDNALYRVEYDEQEDRVKIYFNGMPSDKIRTYLKSNGFRWSPRNKAWQRQITENARRAVRQFESLIQDGTLGKPTIKLEFEDNGELMSLFDTDGISGLTVNDEPAAVFNCPESELDTQGYAPTYIRLADYSHLIDAADGAKTLKGYGFEKATLDELVNACQNYRQVERLAAHLKDDDEMQSAFNIWHWLHTNVRYNYDTPGEEEIRTPARVWADRESGVDCDCLAVFTACLLICMGYKPTFEIVAFNDSPTYSHIYVNLDGMAIDRVLPVFLARPGNITKTQIMEIPVYSLSGIEGCNTLSGVYASTLAKVQNGTATGEDLNNYRKTQVLVTLKGIDEDAYKLAALLMPHIATIGDDGKYYFDNAKFAEIAQKADAGLTLLKQQGASKEVMQNWLSELVSDIDIAENVKASYNGDDTIVVIINPKGLPCRVAGNFTATDLQTLSPMAQTAMAQTSTPQTAAAESPIFATTPAPATPPDAESGNTWLWIAGISAALGIGAALTSGSGKKKRR